MNNEGVYECWAYANEEKGWHKSRGGILKLNKRVLFRARSFLKVISKYRIVIRKPIDFSIGEIK